MTTARIRLPTLFALSALANATGCFQYRSSAPGSPTPGEFVRLRLTESGAARLATQLGPHAGTVEGQLVQLADSGWTVAVSRVVRDGTPVAWAGDKVTLPAETIAGSETRVLDRARTLGVATIVAVVAITAGKLARGAGGGAAGPEGGGIVTP